MIRFLALSLLTLLAPGASAQLCNLQDGFEDNDVCADASGFSSLCQAGLTLAVGDDDWYRVNVLPQHELVLSVRFLEPNFTAVILGRLGCGGAQNLTVQTPGDTFTVGLQNTTGSVVDQRIGLSVAGTSAATCTLYDIELRVVPIAPNCPAQVDVGEPNDCCEIAAPVPPLNFAALPYIRNEDQDWWKLDLPPGDSVDIYVELQTGTGSLTLDLADFCGNPPVMSDPAFLTVTNDSAFSEQVVFRVSYSSVATECARYVIRTKFRGPIEEFCDGTTGTCTPCPCANAAPAGTIGGCINGAGTSARLLPSGMASLSADTLRFTATGANPSTFGILVSGDRRAPTNPANGCFGSDSGLTSPVLDGLRCVVQNLLRHGTRSTDVNGSIGFATNGWGAPSGPAGGLLMNGGFVAGQSRHFQLFYREGAGRQCMTGQNTSNAVSVAILP